MDEENKDQLQDNDQAVESTDQQIDQTLDNGQEDSQDSQLSEDSSDVTVDQPEETQLSRSERRQQSYAEKMADRMRTQADQDASYGRKLFSNDEQYKPLQYQDGEYDIDQLERDRRNYAQQQFNEGVRQGTDLYQTERFADRLETDIERVLSSRTDIDDITEQMLVQSYLDKIGAQEDANGRITIQNPNLRFRDFADKKLEEIDTLVQSKISQSTKNIASQAAKTGVRPNGASQSSITTLSDDALVEKLRASKDDGETQKLLQETRRRAAQALGL